MRDRRAARPTAPVGLQPSPSTVAEPAPAGADGAPGPWELPHPELAVLRPDDLHPALKDALIAGAPLSSLLRPLGPDLWRLPLLTDAACALLVETIEEFEGRGPSAPPNSMNAYGATLPQLTLDGLGERLRGIVADLDVFPECGGASLDEHHGFFVRYSDDHDRLLDLHVDDAEVTLNLCLGGAAGRSFTGGDLVFEGRRCRQHTQSWTDPAEIIRVPHIPGHAIVHAGLHRHRALVTTSGTRTNLVLWCRSSQRRGAAPGCEPWCAEHRPRGITLRRP